MRKRILPLLLVVCMVVSMLPTVAFAATATGETCEGGSCTHMVHVTAVDSYGDSVTRGYTAAAANADDKTNLPGEALKQAFSELETKFDNSKSITITLHDDAVLMAALADLEVIATEGIILDLGVNVLTGANDANVLNVKTASPVTIKGGTIKAVSDGNDAGAAIVAGVASTTPAAVTLDGVKISAGNIGVDVKYGALAVKNSASIAAVNKGIESSGNVELDGTSVTVTGENGIGVDMSAGKLTVLVGASVSATGNSGTGVKLGAGTELGSKGDIYGEAVGIDATNAIVDVAGGSVGADAKAATAVAVKIASVTEDNVTISITDAAVTGYTAVNAGEVTGSGSSVKLNKGTYKGAITGTEIVYDGVIADRLLDGAVLAGEINSIIIDEEAGTYTYSKKTAAESGGVATDALIVSGAELYIDNADIESGDIGKNQTLIVELNKSTTNYTWYELVNSDKTRTYGWWSNSDAVKVSFNDKTSFDWPKADLDGDGFVEDVAVGLPADTYTLTVYDTNVADGDKGTKATDAQKKDKAIFTKTFEVGGADYPLVEIEKVELVKSDLVVTLSREVDGDDYKVRVIKDGTFNNSTDYKTLADGKTYKIDLEEDTGKFDIVLTDAYASNNTTDADAKNDLCYGAEHTATVWSVTLDYADSVSDKTAESSEGALNKPVITYHLDGADFTLPTEGAATFEAPTDYKVDGWQQYAVLNGTPIGNLLTMGTAFDVTGDLVFEVRMSPAEATNPEGNIQIDKSDTSFAWVTVSKKDQLVTVALDRVPGVTETAKVVIKEGDKTLLTSEKLTKQTNEFSFADTGTATAAGTNPGNAFITDIKEGVLTIELVVNDKVVDSYEIKLKDVTPAMPAAGASGWLTSAAYNKYVPETPGADPEAAYVQVTAGSATLNGNYALTVKDSEGKVIATKSLEAMSNAISSEEGKIALGLADGADLPVGNYTVELTVADKDGKAIAGAPALNTVTFSVVEPSELDLALADAAFGWDYKTNLEAATAARAKVLDVAGSTENIASSWNDQVLWVTLNREVVAGDADAVINVKQGSTTIFTKTLESGDAHKGIFYWSFVSATDNDDTPAAIPGGEYTVELVVEDEVVDTKTVTIGEPDNYPGFTAKYDAANDEIVVSAEVSAHDYDVVIRTETGKKVHAFDDAIDGDTDFTNDPVSANFDRKQTIPTAYEIPMGAKYIVQLVAPTTSQVVAEQTVNVVDAVEVTIADETAGGVGLTREIAIDGLTGDYFAVIYVTEASGEVVKNSVVMVKAADELFVSYKTTATVQVAIVEEMPDMTNDLWVLDAIAVASAAPTAK